MHEGGRMADICTGFYIALKHLAINRANKKT